MVAVKYHSNNPSINAATSYGTYISVGTFKSPTSQGRLATCLAMLVLGGLIAFYALKFADQAEGGSYAMPA